MIDDHPIIIEGYQSILKDHLAKYQVVFETANSCQEGLNKLEESQGGKPFDIVILDIGLPPAQEGKINSGEDLGLYIREHFPQTRIIVLTMFSDSVRLLSIIKSLQPEGFLIKTDVNSSEFLRAFDTVLDGKIYNSQGVQLLMRKEIIHDYHLDKTDRDILSLLSRGLKSKEIPDHLPVSLPSVEKRKKNMREVFEVEDMRDITLINKAKELGFI